MKNEKWKMIKLNLIFRGKKSYFFEKSDFSMFIGILLQVHFFIFTDLKYVAKKEIRRNPIFLKNRISQWNFNLWPLRNRLFLVVKYVCSRRFIQCRLVAKATTTNLESCQTKVWTPDCQTPGLVVIFFLSKSDVLSDFFAVSYQLDCHRAVDVGVK